MPLADLLEEEVLLAMPLVALHETCPTRLVEEQAEPESDSAEKRDNPFAVLAQLKSRDD